MVKVKVAQLCPTLWPHGPYSPWNSPGQNTGVGSLSLLQGIFLTQESNWGLLHRRQILYQLSYEGSPNDGRIQMKTEASLRTPGVFFPHLLTLFRSPTPGHSEEKFHPGGCGALPVHPSSSHRPSLPGLSTALPVSPLSDPSAPGPGFRPGPPRAPAYRGGDRLPARLTLEQRADLPLLPTAPRGCPSLQGVFTALLWGGHQRCSWGTGSGCGHSVWSGFTWTG